MSGPHAAVCVGPDGIARPVTVIDNRPRGGHLFIEYFEGGAIRRVRLDALPPQLDGELHSESARLT